MGLRLLFRGVGLRADGGHAARLQKRNYFGKQGKHTGFGPREIRAFAGC